MTAPPSCAWARCGKPATHVVIDPREEPGKQSWPSCADCAREAHREMYGLWIEVIGARRGARA